jgi:hypothetical protein
VSAGLDPDVRFLLARGPKAQATLGVTLLLGVACELGGWWRYRTADRAIRAGRLPTAGFLPDGIVFAVVVLSILLIIGALWF